MKKLPMNKAANNSPKKSVKHTTIFLPKDTFPKKRLVKIAVNKSISGIMTAEHINMQFLAE